MALSQWYHMEVFISLQKCIISHLVQILNLGLEVIQLLVTGFLLYIGDISLRVILSAHSVSFLHLHWIINQK